PARAGHLRRRPGLRRAGLREVPAPRCEVPGLRAQSQPDRRLSSLSQTRGDGLAEANPPPITIRDGVMSMQANADELLLTLEQKADPAHAALVLVDVQNDFLADGGFFHQAGVDVAPMQEALAPLPRLLEQARQAGVLVVFIQAIYDPEYLSGAMLERNRR